MVAGTVEPGREDPGTVDAGTVDAAMVEAGAEEGIAKLCTEEAGAVEANTVVEGGAEEKAEEEGAAVTEEERRVEGSDVTKAVAEGRIWLVEAAAVEAGTEDAFAEEGREGKGAGVSICEQENSERAKRIRPRAKMGKIQRGFRMGVSFLKKIPKPRGAWGSFSIAYSKDKINAFCHKFTTARKKVPIR